MTSAGSKRIRNRAGGDVSILGLGGNDRTTPQMVDRAVRSGINYLFFYSTRFEGMVEGVRYACRDKRDSIVVATGTEDRSPAAIKRFVDEVSAGVGIDVIDVLFAEYVSPDEDMACILGDGGAVGAIEELKSAGRVRYVGLSVHDRDLGTKIVETGRVDVLMHRYNMAHRKSEAQLLPTALTHNVPVVAFTCTRWGSLLRGHPDWHGSVPTGVECYRFALAHPAVELAMTAPGSVAELDANLQTLDGKTVDAGDWNAYGDLIYGQGMDAFETRWP